MTCHATFKKIKKKKSINFLQEYLTLCDGEQAQIPECFFPLTKNVLWHHQQEVW